MLDSKNVLIAVPAFNEEESLPEVLELLLERYDRNQIVVINDGSKDRTASVARNFNVKLLDLPINLGVGGAMRTAFLFALRQDFDAVVQFDADGQHLVQEIPTLLSSLNNNDLVIGSRFAGVGNYRTIGPRRWAMRLLAFFISRSVNHKLTDVTSGFRASGRKAVELFASNYPSEYLGDTVESIVIAHKSKLKIAEVPVAMAYRQKGKPSQSLVQATLFLGRAFIVLLLSNMHKNSSRK